MAMMQTSMGFSKFIIIFGAGCTFTLLLSNGKLKDLLAELRGLFKGDEAADAQAVAQVQYKQVRRLAMEVRQVALTPQITVINGGSSVDVRSLVVPAAALWTVGYGYMRWKGYSLSYLVHVTKNNITNAVSNLKNNLEQVSDAVAAAKKHLSHRVENLDGKVDKQAEISESIKTEMNDVKDSLSQLEYGLGELNEMVFGMDVKIMTLDEKQEFARRGVHYLCNIFGGMGVKGIPDILDPADVNNLRAKGTPCTHGSKSQSRMLTRRNSVKANVNA
ncbi:uncharacterized protein LOC143631594 [Bidens hawaiensis]|uniref:uncharacterized protein LOC143631594 n=1 Tax=Bidens hawaiensis TaxID=980011 RepID=UPI004049ADE9